ncbi:flagellar hook-basal body complex protein [Agrobacterium vitis]|uniref:Flagellar hook protein FlgE n=1 Tax=Agrobacterium vitis TaxID=373 RepID=A0ABD6GKF5_AGRVI|nr:flagellar hook protein FlgE [Agrobacterium vitis]MUO81895.1 flagellar hook-basal body complex protein [Agrobacterium vitis]MUO97705.1 flagellar hook-basal body complex protein [Agrobacterium vitis]MUP07936.1 flagellar hook-basal body complex protein [Agrobacterium vitis]MUZ85280.1 flagellar hook-basal body complex protein [Agrobacterium vitis]MVA12634.1 flagellar hook-basal body complex protein [Agrobacterium vitis]
MSLSGSMNTAVSGLQAQASKLSTVGDNVANSDTTGYKRVSTAFSSLVVGSSGSGTYNSGGVQTTTVNSISEEGSYQSSTSETDLAIKGDGYFVVQDEAGSVFLTRAGDFQADENGYMVNSAGYTLLGYSYENGEPASVINGFEGLEPVKIQDSSISANATTNAVIDGNLKSGSDTVTSDLPSSNSASATWTFKSSMVAYDSLGNANQYDIYYTKTADNEWQADIFRTSEATDETNFPYTNGVLGSTTLTFDSDGAVSSGGTFTFTDSTTSSPQTIEVDMSDMTQLNSANSSTGDVDGNGASAASSVTVNSSGNIVATYQDGSTANLYKVALATVASPDNMKSVNGTAYQVTADAGTVVVGFANTGSFGSINSKTLESSNVDLATELTNMIQSQRSYSANSKVFQTAADMLDTLISLKR